MNPLSLLLNWRLVAGLILCVAAAAGGWKCYVLGKKTVQAEFDAYKAQQVADALAAEQAARAKEHAMQATNQKVTENYESLKTATATAVGALDAERMRLQAALAASSAPGDPGAVLRADGTAKDYILERCLGRYETVARDAAATANKVIGLQDYINHVVPK